MYSDLKYLEVPLPEDVQKLKWHGDFAALDECIAQTAKGYSARASKAP